MVIELSSDQSFHWMMPRDGGAEFLSRIGAGSELAHRGGTQAALADGSVRFLSAEIPHAERQAMLSISEGTSELEARSKVDHLLMHAVSKTR
jgi:hypothetical protein